MILQELTKETASDLLQDGKTIYLQSEDLHVPPESANTFMFRIDAFPAELNFYPKYTPVSKHLFGEVVKWLQKRNGNQAVKFFTFNSTKLWVLDEKTTDPEIQEEDL